MNTLVIDIGGTKFTMAVFEGESIAVRETFATRVEGGRAWMLEQIALIARAWKQKYLLGRCGIGFGGPVEFSRQRVAHSTHVGGWENFALPAWIERELRLPAVMDNDANAGALGEYHFGAGKGCSPLFYMTLSTGIGGGILVDGKAVRGADSYAGEIGHITIRPDGPLCLCGAYGCFERMCSGLWLENDAGRLAMELMKDADFVRGYVVDLALGLKACIMLVNPARIVIGGGIAKAGDALFVPLREELRRTITDWSHARIEVVPAALGDDSVLYGAYVLAKEAAI